ncbi:MAG: von Willebrand factor type A domain-containing protein [Verrucomicrobia bacterium]|nr:von Willebrand factor type A domain-containing protein [Verrucomicrobiota bacterium]
MNDYQLPPDDPRLTAYALGELEGDERAAVEAALRQRPELRAALEEIRAATAQLEDALASEPMPSVFSTPPMEVPRQPAQAAAIIPNRDARQLHKLDGGPLTGGELLRFPRAYFTIAGLAAACFAAIFFIARESLAPSTVTTARPAAKPVATVAPETKTVAPAPTPIVEVALPAESAVATIPPATTPVATEAFAPALVKPDPLSLLGQSKSVEDLTRKIGPFALGPERSSPRASTATTATATVAQMPAPPAEPVRAQPAGVGAETSRTFVYPPDEKMVITAVPSTQASEKRSSIAGATKRPAPAAPSPNAPFTTLLPPSSGSVTMTPPSGDAVAASSTAGAAAPLPPSQAVATSTPSVAPASSFLAETPTSLAESAREALLRPLTFVTGAGTTTSVRPAPDNGFISAAQSPVATVSIESDTSSMSAIRRFLQQKRLPPRETVRIEELVNYFPYHYPPPRGDAPFAASLEVADAPWAPAHRLVRIGLKAREAQIASRPPVNLVFVLDVVDVERLPSRLPMIKEAIQSLVGKLRPDDRVALVSCHHDASLVLPPTVAAKSREIAGALDTFSAAAATSRMKGIQLAYDTLAAYGLSSHGRVILCTDGNAGLTITAEGPLARVIESKTRAGVALTAFAFGMGIYRDSLIEFLADWGSGNYGYIDSRREAERMLAEDVNGPAVMIAKDVKVEVEFNPARVASYRLIGYENRVLGKDDFKAGALATNEVSAGHAVTALFEIVPADGRVTVGASPVAGLRYQAPKNTALDLPLPGQNELLTVKVRYKKPGGAIGRKLDLPLADARTRFVDASADFKFAAAVASFGMVLRDSPHKGAVTLANVIEWAESAALDDFDGNRAEFLELAREVQAIVR